MTAAHHVVVGCGRVGSTLARHLTDLGDSVTVVDRRADAFARFLGGWSGDTLVGNGFDRHVLIDAGVERADAVAAVTNGDNTNIIVARIARERFNVPRVVARIYDPGRASVYGRLGIATIATTPWATDEAARQMLDIESTAWTHATGDVKLVERPAPPDLIGRPLVDAAGDAEHVVGVARRGRALLARADLVLQEGDGLVVAVGRRDS